MSGAELAERLLHEAGVCVLPGSAFGGLGDDHIRISYANSQANLTEALERIRAFVEPLVAAPAYEPTRPRGLRRPRSSPTRGSRPSAPAATPTSGTDDLPPPRDELLRRVAGCDGVLTLLTDRVDDAFLDAAGPGLRVVSATTPSASTTSTSPRAPGAGSPSATRRAS